MKILKNTNDYIIYDLEFSISAVKKAENNLTKSFSKHVFNENGDISGDNPDLKNEVNEFLGCEAL